MTAAARLSAYKVLLDVLEHGKYSNIALQQEYRKTRLSDRDRALCTEIVYGTLQHQRSLDSLLEPLCSRGLHGVDVRVLVILRMSVYQLGYLTRVPEYAVLNDAVELCKAESRKAAGFVNGVLRTFTRDKRSVWDKLTALTAGVKDVAAKLGILYSYPDWLVRELEAEYGRDRTIDILRAGNERPVVSLRVNTARMSREAFLAEQKQALMDTLAPSEVSPVGVRLSQGTDIEQFDAYNEGFVTVQDETSMLIAPLLQVEPSSRVLDLCAGLGTKTTQIVELQGGTGNVTALDIHHHKLERLKGAARRLGLSGVKTVVADARSVENNARYRAAYDTVLLDAPCSGIGVLRRRPEIRWRRTFEESQQLAVLQKELLRAAIFAVRPGGVVVYATCTLLRIENEAVVESVLAEQHGSVVIEDIAQDVPQLVRSKAIAAPSDARSGEGGITVTPELFGTDGFYMARLRKIEGESPT